MRMNVKGSITLASVGWKENYVQMRRSGQATMNVYVLQPTVYVSYDI